MEIDVTAPTPATKMLVGRLLRIPSGRGIAGAWVWLAGRELEAVRTDAMGRYQLPAPAVGGLVLHAAAPGYLPVSSPARADGRDPREKGPILALFPAAEIVGQVTDPKDNPVLARLDVAPVSEDAAGAKGSLARFEPAYSGDDGRFRLFVAPDQEVRITAAAERRVSKSAVVRPPANGRPPLVLSFQLPWAIDVHGEVRDMSGNGIVGARITFVPAAEQGELLEVLAGRDRAMAGFPQTTSGPDGELHLEDLPAGAYVLVVRATGFEVFTRSELIGGGGEAAHRLHPVVLRPAVTLEGRVVDEDHDGVAGAQVRVALVDPTGRRSAGRPGETTSDGEGDFLIADLARGQPIALVVAAEGFVPRRVGPLDVPHEGPLEVVLHPAAAVKGIVRDDRGRPVGGARVRALPAESGTPALRRSLARGGMDAVAVTDDSGGFAISGIEPGAVDLRVAADCCLPAAVRIEAAAGEVVDEIEVVLEQGLALVGKVREPGGSPVASAVVGAAGKSTRTAEDGSFDLRGLPPGAASVWARDPRYGRVEAAVEVGSDRFVELWFLDPAALRGVVVDGDGRPVPDAKVFIAGDGLPPPPFLAADEEGRFRVVVQPGSYRLRAIAGARADSDRGVVLGPGESTELRLIVEGGARVSGTMTGAPVPELARARITATGRSGVVPGINHGDGSYRVEGLASGSWAIVAEMPDGRRATAQVEIEESRPESAADLEFGGGRTLEGLVQLDGAPLSGAWLTLWDEGARRIARATSSIDGRFAVRGLERRVAGIGIETADGALSTERTVDPGAVGPVELEIWTGTIAGAVLDRSTKRPLEGATATLWASAGYGGATRRHLALRADGSFGPLRLVEGRYELTVTSPGRETVNAAVDVHRDRQTELTVWMRAASP